METKYETKETELDRPNRGQFSLFYTLRITIFYDYGFCGA